MSTSSTPNPNSPIRRYAWPVLIIVIAVIGLLIYRSLQFHIVRTDPSMDSVSTATVQITFSFNEALKKGTTSVTSIPSITGDTAVEGKTLRVQLTGSLNKGGVYTIVLHNVTSVKGHTITAQRFTFTAKDIPFQKLSKEQQKIILEKQANKPYTRSSFIVDGSDMLTTKGLSNTQLEDFKQAIYQYSNSVKQKVNTVSIDASTIQRSYYDPENPSPTSFSFTLHINQSAFSAKLIYSDLNAAQLILVDNSTGQQVYDSGVVVVSTPND